MSIPPRTTHDPNTGTLRPNRVKRILANGGTAFIAAGELNCAPSAFSPPRWGFSPLRAPLRWLLPLHLGLLCVHLARLVLPHPRSCAPVRPLAQA
eukprot:COSAG04_NODE_2997_length_3295_cov_1.976846_3_plen_95_part_00